MLELSQKNHFKFGYNGHWFVDRKGPEDVWTVEYGRCTRPAMDWRAECIETAKIIRDTTSLPLWVMYSGGIDSEVVIQAFMFAGIPIHAAITCFENDLNRQDVRYAVKFCETHGVPYKLLRIDIEKFIESGDAVAYAERTQCAHPLLPHTMWAMDQIDGYPVLGSGECYFVKVNAEGAPQVWSADEASRITPQPKGPPRLPEGTWALSEKEHVASWYRHLQLRNREGCAGFFQYTPEIMHSFLVDPLVAKLCGDQIPDHTESTNVKAEIYRQHFLLERRIKYHGFENILDLDTGLRTFLTRRWASHDWRFLTPYTELVKSMAYQQG
jgi:hypothetical protein